MLKRSLGAKGSGMDIEGNFCSFFYSVSVGQPRFPLSSKLWVGNQDIKFKLTKLAFIRSPCVYRAGNSTVKRE